MRPVHIAAVALIAQTMAGCSGSSIAGPSGSNAASTPIGTTGPKPSIVSISPGSGSIYGGSWVTLVGAIDRNATVTVGGIQVSMGWSPGDASIHSLHTPPHAAGPVEIVVTNSGGASLAILGSYTYVEPKSFSVEGSWQGFTVDGSDTWVEFTVRDNLLTKVRCTDPFDRIVEIAVSQPVVNGKVEFVGDAGRFSAWGASAAETAGTIDIAPCSGHPWEAKPVQP